MTTRVRAFISGRVQGVGFRPTVYRYATTLGLCGFVRNDPEGVTLEVEGDETSVATFLERLTNDPPRQAHIAEIRTEVMAEMGYRRFEVVDSRPEGEAAVHISPDLATCDDCLGELFDPADRRYRYPFINCTNCGPRFTIIRDLPYDRDKTSMTSFQMCPSCDAEYHDPADRRFHAQPDACRDCGPRLALEYPRHGEEAEADPLGRAVDLLLTGQIVALKSLGGYHLACDAFDDRAVLALRRRKHRPHKPFAVMFRDLDAVRRACRVSAAEEAELLSAARPIVLLDVHPDSEADTVRRLSAHVAPDTGTIGAFLPYTPLHHLLMRDFEALVMTSGNLADEPIISDESELPILLGPIADAALTHDRPIVHKCDDSVLRVVGEDRQLFRRARGFAPAPVRFAQESPQILAVGGELKNTFCLARDGFAFLSQHIGDLRDLRTYRAFAKEIEEWQRLMRVRPDTVAYDLHPDYLSSRFALRHGAACKVGVQHHHAHVASVMAEHGLETTVLGVALDGTGYGPDGTIWGAEFLLADRADFQRIAHFKAYPLPGGDKAIQEPWRMALSVMECENIPLTLVERALGGRLGTRWLRREELREVIHSGFNAPLASSAGRLFDAAAAMLGMCDVTTYEAQAAVRFEAVADPSVSDWYPYQIDTNSSPWKLDFGPSLVSMLEDRARGTSRAEVSAKFHNTVADAVVHTCRFASGRHHVDRVMLSGGVFQNRLLLRAVVEGLRAHDLRPYTNLAVPPNDGGLALGQAAVAAERRKRGCA